MKGVVIYVGGFELPDKNAAAQRVVSNAKIFRALGYKVILVGVDKTADFNECLGRCDEDFFGFESWSLPYPRTALLWLKYIIGSRALMKFLRSRITLGQTSIVCYNYPAFAQLKIRFLCRGNKALLISDVTEWYDSSGGGVFYRMVKWADTTFRMRIVNTLSDGLITTSKYITNFYKDREKPTVELPTLFDSELFSMPELNSSEKRKFIYVGIPFEPDLVNKKRSNVKERLDIAIEIFGDLHRKGEIFQFDIYGMSVEDYLKVFPEQAKTIVSMDRMLTFHGRCPRSSVLREVAGSDFLVFFRDENRVTLSGFPTKLAESISCGTPVLTNRMMSLDSYNDLEFLIKSESTKDAAAAIQKLIHLPKREVFSLKKAAFNSKAFDYRHYIDEVESFMNKLGGIL